MLNMHCFSASMWPIVMRRGRLSGWIAWSSDFLWEERCVFDCMLHVAYVVFSSVSTLALMKIFSILIYSDYIHSCILFYILFTPLVCSLFFHVFYFRFFCFLLLYLIKKNICFVLLAGLVRMGGQRRHSL